MESSRTGLRITPARRDFKKSSGQNNHFLITALVGLDAVRDGTASLNPEFSTSWRPHDKVRSAARSRDYVIKTSLVWITDLIDEYRKQISKMPGVCSSLSAVEGLDGRSRKLQEFCKILGIDAQTELQMLQLGIFWRNRIVHSGASNKLDGRLKNLLTQNLEYIASEYRGLAIDQVMQHAQNGEAPRFKEVASMIHAAHRFVAHCDATILSKIQVEEHADQIFFKFLSAHAARKGSNGFEKLWPGSAEKTRAA